MSRSPIPASQFCQSETPLRFVGPHPGQRLRFLHTHVNPLPEFPALTHVQEVWCRGDHLVPPHIHATWEISYVLSGRGNWEIEAEPLAVTAGDCWVVRPGELHSGGADSRDPYHLYVLGIDPLALLHADPRTQLDGLRQRTQAKARGVDGTLLLNAPARDWPPAPAQAPDYDFGWLRSRSCQPGPEVPLLMARLLKELDAAVDLPTDSAARRLAVLMCQATLVQLFVILARQGHLTGEPEGHPELPGRFSMLGRYLLSRLQDPPSVADMAAFMGLSTAHFAVTFRQQVGTTPHAYLTKLRLHEAARRLRSCPGQEITALAMDLGFSSPQYFSSAFARHFGCSPTTWRGASVNSEHGGLLLQSAPAAA